MRALHVTYAAEWDFALIHLLEVVVLQGICECSYNTKLTVPPLRPFLLRPATNSPVYHSGFHFPFFFLFSGSLRVLILSEWIIYIYILIYIF